MSVPLLSVFIITHNESRNIERCLKSVEWADEIVVVDSYSQDDTVAIARRYTNKVVQRKFLDYADQKNHALSLCRNEWALGIDADEVVTPELKSDILLAVVKAGHAAYSVERQSEIFGRFFKFTGTQDDKPVRLLRKNKVRYTQPVHEKLECDGSVGHLRGRILHYTYRSINEYWARLNRYTSMEADFFKMQLKPLKPSDWSSKPLFMFFKLYFIKQGFRDGVQGFIFSVFSAYYVFLKHVKHWEKNALS